MASSASIGGRSRPGQFDREARSCSARPAFSQRGADHLATSGAHPIFFQVISSLAGLDLRQIQKLD